MDAGLSDVMVQAVEVATVFADFDDYWSPIVGGQGWSAYELRWCAYGRESRLTSWYARATASTRIIAGFGIEGLDAPCLDVLFDAGAVASDADDVVRRCSQDPRVISVRRAG